MSERWVKVFEKISEWEWYKDSHMVHLFIHLLTKAQYKDVRYKGIEIKRGQLLFGREKCSDDTGISIQSIRTCIDRLKSTNEITIESTKRGSIVTVCNYERYQMVPEKNNQQINQQINHGLTSDQPETNHIQEGIEGIELNTNKPSSIEKCSKEDDRVGDDFATVVWTPDVELSIKGTKAKYIERVRWWFNSASKNDYFDSLKETFPDVDINQQMKEVFRWFETKKNARRTRVSGTVLSWLRKEQERAIFRNGRV